MNEAKPAPRPLQTLRIASPWRMILVGKDLEIIVTGLNKERVAELAGDVFRLVSEERPLGVQELSEGASFEELQKLKQL